MKLPSLVVGRKALHDDEEGIDELDEGGKDVNSIPLMMDVVVVGVLNQLAIEVARCVLL
jgi:hypothetical protein